MKICCLEKSGHRFLYGGLENFRRFAVNLWEVDAGGKSDEQFAKEGLSCAVLLNIYQNT